MALVLKDRVKETSTTAGTGTITLAGAVAGFQSFSAVGNGNTTYYAIVDNTTGDWEVGIGTYTASGTTLSRTTVLSSSNSGSLVSFTSNPKDVFVTYPSEKSVYEDASNVVNATSFGAITATSAALTTGTVSTTPASATDIANKSYVDGLVTQGISYHEPVFVESPNTVGNLNATYNNGASGVGATLTNAGTQVALTIDGVLMTVGKRVLIYNQTNQAENGVYTVTTVGTGSTNWVLTRATDADTYGVRTPSALGYNDAFFVTNGDTGAGETYVCTTTAVIVFGTTAITFAQISSAQVYNAGTGLTLSPATTFNIANTGVTANTYGSASAVPVITINAQGQATGVTNTTIAINGSQVSGNISGSAGSVANALTLGTYLTGGTYNGSAAVTATVDATSANTASKVVARDSSGNFSAGTITATLNGSATSTTTATNLAGGAANQIAYQSGSGTTTFATAPTTSSTYLYWNGSAFAWGAITSGTVTSITAGAYLTGGTITTSGTIAVDATSANTASKVVARDASGNFSAGTVTAALSGNALTATTATNQSGGTVSATTGAFSGLLTVQQNSTTAVQIASGFTIGMGDWGLRNTTPYGYIQFGPANTSYAHIYTDRPNFYFDKDILVNGNLVLTSANYNSYAPTLTGTGASGTWGINVTGSSGSTSGNAATATTLSSGQSNWVGTGVINNVVGMLAWKNYNNGHVIFDASASTSPSGSAVNNTNPDYSWGGTYPTLMGWNGSNTYGVRVDRSYQTEYLYSSVGAYATIYYDSNDTSYYVDPNSNSKLVNLGLGGATPDVRLSVSGDAHISAYLYMGGTAGTSGSWSSRLISSGGATTLNTSTFLVDRTGYGGGGSFNMDTAGNCFASSSFRAPIFYDSDNTGYYVDPASTSNSALRMRGGALFGPNTTWGAYLSIGTDGNASTSYASVAATDGNLHMDAKTGCDMYLNYYAGNAVRAYGSFYAQILYDLNNTAYYVDPASTSVLNSISQAGVYTRTTAGVGYLSGNYPSSETPSTTGAIYTIGGSYAPSSTSFSNMYGIGYCYADGISVGISGASGWGQYVNSSGTNTVWLGGTYGQVISTGAHRGTIYYDYSDTGYYIDPASTSYIYEIQAVNWFRSIGQTGLYSQSYGSHFYPQSNGRYWSITGNGSTDYGGLLFKTNFESTIKGYVYWDANGFGLLHGGGGWSVRGNLAAIGGQFYGSWFSDTDLRAPIFYDYNNTGYYVDPNGTSNMYRVVCTSSFEVSGAATIYDNSSSGRIFLNGFQTRKIAFNGSNYEMLGNGLVIDGLGVGTNPSGTAGEIRATNNITAYYSSDIKFKTNVRDIPNAVETVESIGGKLFDWNDEYIEEHGGEDGYFIQKEDFGVIAQDVLKVFPVAVRTRPDGSLAVDYEKLSALAFAAVAELSTRVKSLEARI